MNVCQKGTPIIDIAELSIPNVSFYALALAMTRHYWLVHATSVAAFTDSIS